MHDERFARTELMLGAEGLERLARARVILVGLGAVGSVALEALARLGIGHLTLVDFDTVCLSNLNRQLLALDSTLGRPKHEVAACRVRDINPSCAIDARCLRVTEETAGALLAARPDLVVDAIDAPSGKLALVAACQAAGVPVVCSMGAALRRDPSRVRTGTLAQTHDCPLARLLRRGLRERGLSLAVPCVYSEEPADRALSGEPVGSDGPGSARRVLGTLPTVTGVFGLRLADLALSLLLADA